MSTPLLSLSIRAWLLLGALLDAAAPYRLRQRARGEAGQTTAEYALVILGAATVAVLVLAWATKTTKIGKLLDAVVDSVISRVT